tara:strand:- start:3394 stop:4473 length:1080 start_codon:yes stop_codon:yes gene_type:complete
MSNSKDIRVIVTGAGAPGIAGTIYALKTNPDNRNVWVMGVDSRDDAVGRYMTDAFSTIPVSDNDEYINKLVEIAKENRIDVILPQVTSELDKISNASNMLRDEGIFSVISPSDTIHLANDKFMLLNLASEMNIPCPNYRLVSSEKDLRDAANDFGYPKNRFVVKPRNSNGQRGFRIVTENRWDTNRFLTEKPSGTEISLDDLLVILSSNTYPDLIVSDYLPGIEYTVDVFAGENVKLAVPRIRTQIRSGVSFLTEIDMRKDLIEWSLQLTDKLRLKYGLGFQFKLDSQGTPCLLECNPRVQGTMIAGVFAGFNFIYYGCRESMGIPVSDDEIKPIDDIRMIRYWGGLVANSKTTTSLRI